MEARNRNGSNLRAQLEWYFARVDVARIWLAVLEVCADRRELQASPTTWEEFSGERHVADRSVLKNWGAVRVHNDLIMTAKQKAAGSLGFHKQESNFLTTSATAEPPSIVLFTSLQLSPIRWNDWRSRGSWRVAMPQSAYMLRTQMADPEFVT
jgi:hypothetical protein